MIKLQKNKINTKINGKWRKKQMSNILDYIKWRGDLTIQNDPFNEIDSLILSRFSYLPFDGIIEKMKL